MSRNKSNSLFQLIKSLDQSEKGYFKKSAAAHAKGKMIYLRIFDLIDKQKEYDEDKVRQKAGNFSPELFKRTKHYLYHLILRNLDQYHSDSSIDDVIRKQIKYAELLHSKGLYDQAYIVIQKGKTLAYKYEKYLLLPLLFQLESRVSFQFPGTSMLAECIDERRQKIVPVFEKGRDIIEYLTLNMEMTRFHRTEGLNYTRGESLKQLNSIIQSPYLQDENKASSYLSKVTFYGLNATYYLNTHRPHTALKYEIKKVQLMESHPEQIEEFVLGYIVALNNLNNTLVRLKKFKEAEQCMEKLKAVPENYRNGKKELNQLEVFSYYYCDLTDVNNKSGHFEKNLLLVNTIEKGLKRFGNKMRDQMWYFIHFNIAFAYFGQKQYKKSLSWLNEVLNSPQKNSLQALHSISRLLNIMNNYELNRFDYLEYLVRSSQRYFENRERLFEVEKVFLNYIGKKLFPADKKDRQLLFAELKKKLQIISKDPHEGIPLRELDLISWVESKIENKSFAEVLKKKAGEH